MNNTFYSTQELQSIGFKSCGKNVLISRYASIFTPELISIGDDTRVDDFSILSGSITLGSNVHIAAYCGLFGTHGITIMDFSGLSSKVLIYSATDDFGGDALVGPQVPNQYRNIISGQVVLEKYVQVGAASVILPAVTLAEGSATGALTLVKHDLPAWTISVGVPSKVLKKRSKKIIELANKFKVTS